MIGYGSWALQTWPTGAARHIRFYSALSIYMRLTQVKLKQAKQQIILALTNDQLVLEFLKNRAHSMWQMVHHVTISDQIQFYTIQLLENHRHYVKCTNHRSFVFNIRFDSSYRTGSLGLKVFCPVYCGQEGVGGSFSQSTVYCWSKSATRFKRFIRLTERVESTPVGEIRLRSCQIRKISLL